MSIFGNFFGGGTKPENSNGNENVLDHSFSEGGDLLNRPTSRFGGSRSNITMGKAKTIAPKIQEKSGKTKEEIKKYYGAQGSEQLRKIAPALAESWGKALPESFASKDKAKKTMARILGGSGDAWVRGDKLRSMQTAVKEGRWSHPSLRSFTSDEVKKLKYDSESRRNFVSGVNSLNPKKFY